ncbi:hypothetical protein [Streptomyces sp. NPDC047079]|uniref:hypothetical protein n=1 Tax=Streptomyces sp. NPDC047079 TaxID=3154607 RepID=UPI0033CE45D6
MSQQQYPQPQQPGWGGPQQPGYGTPPIAPQPPKKSKTGKILGFGCLGVVALFVLIGIIAAIAGGGGSGKSGSAGEAKPAATATKGEKATAEKDAAGGKSGDKPKSSGSKDDKAKKVAVFKVWGTAAGGVDITYGSDSDTRQGHFKNGAFEATLPVSKDALYFNVMGQLSGGGDINCSVTIDGKTKKGHASGGYNICDAQLNAGLLGGWD